MESFGKKVNDFLVTWRRNRIENGILVVDKTYARDSYLISADTPRFGSGEGKGQINESARGDDLYILVDVMNHSITYTMQGFENILSPDDHFADLKRIIAAAGRKPRRINVIMPYLYEGRQLKQKRPRVTGLRFRPSGAGRA
jgi:ribose-phosphate pyrophosphokinase